MRDLDTAALIAATAAEAAAELVALGVPARRITAESGDTTYVLWLDTPDGPVPVTRSHTGWAYGPDCRHVDSTAALLEVTAADRLTAADLANEWGYSVAHAQRILRGVPRNRVIRSEPTGAKLYRLTDAEAARDSRPGRGARTDLRSTS